VDPEKLNLPQRQARAHPAKQISQIEDSMRAVGFLVPVVIDEQNVIRAGIGRVLASRKLGLRRIPAVRAQGLSEAQLRAFALADNKLAENSKWDREVLAVEFPEISTLLIDEGLDLSITGFAAAEIDQIVIDFEDIKEPTDVIPDELVNQPPISKHGDIWQLGNHKLCCGDAGDEQTLTRLLGNDKAAAAFLDPPYNVKIANVVGRGRIKHQEFAMGSGEMSSPEFVDFLKKCLGTAAASSQPGAIHFVCMDWRHLPELFEAGGSAYGALLNLAVWVKSNAGQGSFYRSQHEHIAIYRVGAGPHQNNIELGRYGRSRSNVWSYAGVNTFRAGRLDDLRGHPTVKPIAMVADAIKDCTRRGDLVLDTFCGSGTTLLAAERVGRRFAGVELEPKYVDLAVRRWQKQTGKDALHQGSARCFDESHP
jgi:DNA modification methylase